MKSGVESGTTPLGNRYRILRDLGQGGFGHTYVAEDLHRFNELCVLKKFVPQLSDPTLLKKAEELFEREANILYQLEHPQIPKFREILRVEGTTSWGGIYLVQDYVEGPTYRDLLQNRSSFGSHFSEIEITQLLHQLLPVLRYLHEQGIIHRDISPENLILRNTDGLPVLIDFGSVKAVAATVQQELSNASPEQDKTRIGKAGYVPPEQLQMGTTNPTSDLYALAATALVLATGKEPQELYDNYHSVWNWSQEISLNPTLSQVLDRMLDPIPDHRFESADSVIQALQTTEYPEQGHQNGSMAQLPKLTNVPDIAPVAAGNLDPNLDLNLDLPLQPESNLETEDDAEIAVAAVPAAEAAAVSYLAPNQEGTDETVATGCWQSILGLMALLGLTSLLFWLFSGSQLPRFQWGSGDRPDISSPPPVGSTGLYSAEETARKADLKARREALQVDEDFLIRLTDQIFYQQYPDMQGRRLTNSIEDAPLRLRWDNTANDSLDLMEQHLSQRARRGLGGYGPANRDAWKAAVNRLNVSSRALYDLADAKFSVLYPDQNVDESLSQPIGQIWYGLADDRVRDLESGAVFENIQFEPGTYSQQLTGRLKPGEGQVLTLDLTEGQILRLNLQATSDSTLLSLYLPTPTDETPFLLSDSTDRTWSGRLTQSGYYEVVIVSKATEEISYQLNVAVDNVRTTPKETEGEEPQTVETPDPEAQETQQAPPPEQSEQASPATEDTTTENPPANQSEGVQF